MEATKMDAGYRRTLVYRYSPRFVRTRFNCVLSEGLMARLTPERRMIMEPIQPKRSPE